MVLDSQNCAKLNFDGFTVEIGSGFATLHFKLFGETVFSYSVEYVDGQRITMQGLEGHIKVKSIN